MQISDEMVEAFGNAFWSVNAASKIDGQREHIRSALEAALSTDAEPVKTAPAVAAKAPFEFDRYINGALMAEGVTIENADTLGEAAAKAAKIASRGSNGEVPVLALRSALSAQVQDVAGWQSIETAPKDKDVLLAVDHEEGWSYVAQGRWVDGEEDQIDQPGHDAGFVDCDYQCFFPGRSFGPDRSRYEGKQPTHWMPLPASPASKHGDAE